MTVPPVSGPPVGADVVHAGRRDVLEAVLPGVGSPLVVGQLDVDQDRLARLPGPLGCPAASRR